MRNNIKSKYVKKLKKLEKQKGIKFKNIRELRKVINSK